MNNQNKATGGGVSSITLLFVLFIALKSCKIINWSWWWVLSPLWLPLTLLIAGLLILYGGTYLYHVIKIFAKRIDHR